MYEAFSLTKKISKNYVTDIEQMGKVGVTNGVTLSHTNLNYF